MSYKHYYCPKCGKRMIAQSNYCCEYRKTKNGVISGCGIRVPYNKTWRFCPICGQPISRMGWLVRDKDD